MTRSPGARKIKKTSLKKCERKNRQFLGGVSRDDIASAQNSSGESAWKHGYQVTTCFVQVTHGKVEGALKGIEHKPLSSIR